MRHLANRNLAGWLMVLFAVLLARQLGEAFYRQHVMTYMDGTPYEEAYAPCPRCEGRGNWDFYNRYYRCTGCLRTYEKDEVRAMRNRRWSAHAQ